MKAYRIIIHSLRIAAISLPALLAAMHSHAQPANTLPRYFARHYTQADGLSGRGGFRLLRDEQGFLWADGDLGPSRFDGHHFTTTGFGPGLTANPTGDLRTDTNGVLYAFNSTGIYRYTGIAGNAFRQIPLPASVVDVALLYPLDSNHIYLAGEKDRHLYLLDHGRLRLVPAVYQDIIRITGDRNGYQYLLSTDSKVYALRDTVVTDSVLPPYIGHVEVYQPMERLLKNDNRGRVFFHSLGLFLLDGRRKPLAQPYLPLPGDAPFYNYTMAPVPQGQLYRREGSQWTGIAPLPADVNYNSDLLTGKNNTLWLVTEHGLSYFYPRLYRPGPANRLLYYYTTDAAGRRVLRQDSAIYRNAAIRQFYRDPARYAHSYCYRARNGTIWLCTLEAIYYQPGGSGPLKRYMKKPDASDVFHAATEDGAGRMWFESLGGITRYDKGNFYSWSLTNGLDDNAFYSAAIDRDGVYYAGSRGLYAWEAERPSVITQQVGLPRVIIKSIAIDRDGAAWVAPQLARLVKVGRRGPGKYYAADSLELEVNGTPFVADAIAFDHDGNLWTAGFGKMVVYLRQANGGFSSGAKLVVTEKSQHLEPLRAVHARLFGSEDGREIYLSGDSGRVIFNAQELIQNYPREAPNLRLTGVQLFHRNTDWQAMGQPTDKYGLPTNPILRSTQNGLSFLFTGITDAEPDAVVYSYRLEGYERDWQPLTKEGEAGYTNLSPGRYTFYVKAADINGVWSAPLAFSFTILPPWYRTWWAIVLWSLAGLGLVWLLFRLRLRAVKRRARMERLVVEQQLKALRAQINPHFLQNTFEFLSQSLDEQPLPRAQQIIRQLSAYLRNVLHRTDETTATLEDELEFAAEYLAINQLLFRDAFRYCIDVADDVEAFAITLPSLMLQPLLENAIKHGARYNGDGSATIGVQVFMKDRAVHCIISNAVAGAEAAAYAPGYIPKGLSITMQRLELLYKNAAYKPSLTAAFTGGMYQVTIVMPL